MTASSQNAKRKAATRVVRRLREAGHEAYFAGGAVRDLLLGIEPRDFDIATSARPEDVEQIFSRTIAVGRAFGVMVVLQDGQSFETATFRSDGTYMDGRRPESISYSSAQEDVQRRDFTINGVLFDPVTNEYLDWVGGQADLKDGLIRAIGEPHQRFKEDHLRLIRAVRFAARFGFDIEPKTRAAILELRSLASTPSAERIGEEIRKMFGDPHPGLAFRWLRDLGLLEVILPEVAKKIGSKLPGRYFSDGVANTALERVDRLLSALNVTLPLEIPLALVMEDLDGSSPGGDLRAADRVMRRLRFPVDLITRVLILIRCRDRMLFARNPSPARYVAAGLYGGSDVLSVYGEIENRETSGSQAHFAAIPAHSSPQPLLLNGNELMALGVPRGPRLGWIMRRLKVEQWNGSLRSADEARSWLQHHLNHR